MARAHTLAMLAMASAVALAADKPPSRVVATVTVEQERCWGGAAPSREEQMTPPPRSPLRRAPLTLYAGSIRAGKVVASLTTDAAGRFDTQLPPGSYCLARGQLADLPLAKALRAPPSRYSPTGTLDNACLRWLEQQCDARVEVKDQPEVKLRLTVVGRCDKPWAHPCWVGPRPP